MYGILAVVTLIQVLLLYFKEKIDELDLPETIVYSDNKEVIQRSTKEIERMKYKNMI